MERGELPSSRECRLPVIKVALLGARIKPARHSQSLSRQNRVLAFLARLKASANIYNTFKLTRR